MFDILISIYKIKQPTIGMSTNPADGYAEKMRIEREANPIVIDRLDDSVLVSECQIGSIALILLTFVELPLGVEVVSVIPSGASAWCKTFKIDARLNEGEIKPYFMKVDLPSFKLMLWLLTASGSVV